ncbi:hypothetical protein [Mucilaginibacter sp.]
MIDAIFNDNKDNNIPLDFESLRSHGIELIQKMAGNIWTDFNLHDPGVTILEQLCYAITDLAYQTDFDITDLLSDKDGKISYESNSFFPRQEILTSNPVTITDYRKAIIDEVSEIDNIWFIPVTSATGANAMQGLYKVMVQVKIAFAKELLAGTKDEQFIKDRIRAAYNSKRNLCEDIFDEIIILKPIEVTIQADIQIEPGQVPENVLIHIYIALRDAVNRPVKYLTELEMLKKGYTIDQIYCGPKLNNGLIPNSELKDKQQNIEAINIIQSISNVPGVVLIKKLSISRNADSEPSKMLVLADSEFAFLDIESVSSLNINLFIDKYRVPPIRKTMFADLLHNVIENSYRDYVKSFYRSGNHLTGTYHDNSEYYSIQNYFPLVYGIGEEGLLKSAPDERKAQAKQLKAYLMLFEQVLANYLAQLNHLAAFFSNEVSSIDTKTYFANPLYNVPEGQDIIGAYTTGNYAADDDAGWEKFKNDTSNGYINALNNSIESDTSFDTRKNQMFDHLLARFNETSVTYPVKLYNLLYRSNQKKHRVSPEIKWKSSILKDFSKLNYNRARAFNYLDPEDSEYDFEAKMRKLLYIVNNKDRQLTAVFDPTKVTLENAGKKKYEKDDATDTKDETDWNPEFQNIILSKKDVNDLIENNLLAGAESRHKQAFVFRSQDISVLKYAININNYRIGPDPYKDGDNLVLYKSPADEYWSIISRYSNKKEPAIITLKKLVNNLIKMSTRSEGFYLVEHVLLRPDLNSKAYGFKLYKDEHHVIFEHAELLTFYEREDAVTKLLNFKPGEQFYLAQQNIDMALVNKQIHNKKWVDRADQFVQRAEQQLKQATNIFNISIALANKATPQNIATANQNKAMAEQNKIIATTNKDIADQFLEITKKSKNTPGVILSHTDKSNLEKELQKLIAKYYTDVEKLLKQATLQEQVAKSLAEDVNNIVLGQLAGAGKLISSGNNYNDLDTLFNNIKAYGDQSFPRLKMLVNVKDNKLINEDFFSFNMSVVLPDWPARFQNLSFKSCLEGLFKYHAPAHLKLHIQWFNVNKMIKFEPIFLKWKQSLATNRSNDDALQIISLLNDRSDISHPH